MKAYPDGPSSIPLWLGPFFVLIIPQPRRRPKNSLRRELMGTTVQAGALSSHETGWQISDPNGCWIYGRLCHGGSRDVDPDSAALQASNLLQAKAALQFDRR
jgi:hypothetical protein